jgi:anaerobic dimethyl sulfoxide reductase subunit C
MTAPAERKIPLMAFTLLSQTAVGAFWTVAVPYLTAAPRPGILPHRLFGLPFLAAVLAALAAGAVVSLLHLGRPWHAPAAIANLRASWLSREIFFEVAFMALVLIMGVLRWRGREDRPVFRALVIAAAVAGALFLLSMSRLYMLRTVPAWRSLHTPVSFLATAALLGPLAVLAGRRILFDFPGTADFFSAGAEIAALAAILAAVLSALLLTPRAGLLGGTAATLRDLPAGRIYPLLVFRLLYLGAAMAFVFLFHGSRATGYAVLAFVAAATAEILGRYLFYALYARTGV